MPTGPNRILDASNNATSATIQSIVVQVLSDLIYGKTGSGEVGLKVIDIAGGSGASNYTSNIVTATSNGNVPSGVYGWSITAISGTVTVGGQSLPVGASVGGGGYGGATSLTQVAYTVSGGSALISYDN